MDIVLDAVRYAIAAVIVAFPLFVILSLILERLVRRTPDTHKLPVARWLTYLTMFLAAAVMMGDVITLLFYFLDGSVTTRFVLKAVVLLVIAEVILSYYYITPRSVATGERSGILRKMLAGTGLVIVFGAVSLGFVMAGSPFSARLVRLDERRVTDLREIHQAIQQMTTERKQDTLTMTRPLPTDLEEVAAFRRTQQSGRELSLLDPQTGDADQYRSTSEKSYELCTTFTVERKKTFDLFWNHPAGKHCYSFKVESPP